MTTGESPAAIESLAENVGPLIEAKSLREFILGLQETLKKESPLLKSLDRSALSSIKELSKSSSVFEVETEAGREFLKTAFQIALETRKSEGAKKTVEYLAGTSAYYGLVVAAPCELTLIAKKDEVLADKFLNYYIAIMTGSSPKEVVPEEESQEYAAFEKKVREKTGRVMQKLSAKIIGYCCCQNLNLNPKIGRVEQVWPDFWVSESLPVQVNSQIEPGLVHSCKFCPDKTAKPPHLELIFYLPPFFQADGQINLGLLEDLGSVLTSHPEDLFKRSSDFQLFSGQVEIAIEKWQKETSRKIPVYQPAEAA